MCARRRRKSEQTQQLMLWKIDWEDIDFLSSSADSNLAKSTVIISMCSPTSIVICRLCDQTINN